MRRALAGLVAAALGLALAAEARAHGRYRAHRRSHVVIGGAAFFPPYYYRPYYYHPYYLPPPYPVYVHPPPLEDPGWGAPPPEASPGEEDRDGRAAARRATYGLVQLRGVPEGASVDLDGRFWLTAEGLDERWLALPEGEHTLTVRARDARAVERRLQVRAGTTHVVRFGPSRQG